MCISGFVVDGLRMRSPEMRKLISRKGSSVSEIVCVNFRAG